MSDPHGRAGVLDLRIRLLNDQRQRRATVLVIVRRQAADEIDGFRAGASSNPLWGSPNDARILLNAQGRY